MKLDFDTTALLLAQLGNITRLQIVRLLVRAGSDGLAVGDIQRDLNIPGSTLSHHLSHLRNVGLIRQERQGTMLRCFVEYQKIAAIVDFLTAECCVDMTAKKTDICAAA